MANQSYVYLSGVTNIEGVDSFEIGVSYSKNDIVFFSGYTAPGTPPVPTTAESLGVATGHYYYTGDNDIVASASNSPDQSTSDWTQKLFARSSYGASVSYENSFYNTTFGDGYYSVVNKGQNSLKTKFNLKFERRTDKEIRALSHLLEDSFNKGEKPSGGYTGIYFTPFAPYNTEREFYIEDFDRSFDYPDVNSISTSLYREDQSIIDWQGYYIPFNQTQGFFEHGVTYSKHDIVYVSGNATNDSLILEQSGWYYYTGDTPTVASLSNSPTGIDSLWTDKEFYFSVNQGVSVQSKPRYLKFESTNGYFIRANDGLNKNLLNIELSFDGRTDKETKAMVHFLENKQGKNQFKFTPPAPYNKKNITFFCPRWEHVLVYKDNNNVNLNLVQFPINLVDLSFSQLNLVTIDPYYLP